MTIPSAASAETDSRLPSEPTDDSGAAPPAEQATIWMLSAIYGSFYFCRTNISAALPGVQKLVQDGGLALSGKQTGSIQAISKLTYGVGQLFNGQLSEYFSPRWLLAIGMFGSAALNILFARGARFETLYLLWALNGYAQSLGWTPVVRVVGNWTPAARRGRAIGIVGIGYQVTLGLTYLVASYSAEFFGWRGALYVPALILTAAGAFMVLFLKDAPRAPRKAPPEPPQETERRSERETFRASTDSALAHDVARPVGVWRIVETVALTLSNPGLWVLGVTLGLLNACRYGFVDWGISHLVEVQKSGLGKAGLQYGVLAIGATAGSFLTGWATDRFFGGRRAPVISGLMVLLAVLTLLYHWAASTSLTATVCLLVLIGFCIFGPQVLLVGTAPADLARRGTPAAAAGFVNFLGYMGAAVGDMVTGYYKAEEHGGWRVAIYIWAAWALAAAFTSALLWNARPGSRAEARG
ncbi:MAG TPA: MFS transporter [Pirellulales bacterium]